MFDVAIIGGGASGLVSAITAKRKNPNYKIIIVEALQKVGKKILATGNGRCNITNLNVCACDYNNPNFVKKALEQYPPSKIIDFFRSLGILCYSDDQGRTYPLSNTAASVLDCLRYEAERLNVEIVTETHVDSITYTNGIFIINNKIRSRKVIIATGGKSSPSQGSDGSGYALLKSLGHKITPLYPGLVQLTVKENVKLVKGLRAKAEVRLDDIKFSGEILFTDYGLSGIVVMDLSRFIKNTMCDIYVDLTPSLSFEEVFKFIADCKKNNPENSPLNILSGLVPRKIGEYVIKRTGMSNIKNIGICDKKMISTIINCMKNLKFTVTGTKDFNSAQITVGGVDTKDFNSSTMESLKVRNLYCVGELLDIDAPCGGYNLTWAWASAMIAGNNI